MATGHFNNSSAASNYSWPTPEDGYESIMDIAYFINKYYLWVILAFGLPGNIAAIFTIFRMRHLGSFGFYVVLLAVVDTLALIVKILNYQLIAERVNIYPAGCKFTFFLANFLITYANWILVLMAGGRLLAVKFPLKVQHFNYRSSVVAAVVVGIILALPYLPILWIVSFHCDRGCIISSNNTSLLTFLYWTHRCLYGFFPFVILLASNIFIARVIQNHFRIRHALRQLTRLNTTSISAMPDTSIQRQILVLLFTTTFVFVLFTFPLCAYSVAEHYWKVQTYTKVDAIKYLLKQLAYVMCDTNHAVNFYLYFLSARKFRANFLRNPLSNWSKRRRAARI